MKTICIYHSIDLDGWMSAAIVQHAFGKATVEITDVLTLGSDKLNHQYPVNAPFHSDKLHFFGYNYGDTIPDLSDYDEIIMCDVSFPAQTMIKIYEDLQAVKGNDRHFIYIDHHVSAINDIKMVSRNGDVPFYGIQNIYYAACELTWEYFFPQQKMPEIVRLLGRYDCFGHKGTDEEQKVTEFQYGARNCIGSRKAAYSFLISSLQGNEEKDISGIMDIGKAIYDYLCVDAKNALKLGFEIKLSIPKSTDGVFLNITETFRFLAFNKDRFNPGNFDIDYIKEGYDGAASFYYNGKSWLFSLYSSKDDVDVSEIAKFYGGGGHKGAAGFQVKNINNIIFE